MARLVAAFGSSHSLMLVSQREDWQHGFRVVDAQNPHLVNRQGQATDYATLLAQAPAGADELASPERLSQRFDAAQAAMDRLREAIAAARLDVLVIVGDDQNELFTLRNTPAVSLYCAPTLRNTARPPRKGVEPWPLAARYWRHEPEQDRDYPVAHELARGLIRALCDRDFDIASLDGLAPGQSEGHAFQFVHRRLLDAERPLPVVPVVLNTFDPPNQPTPRRCVALGAALRESIMQWPEDLRVGVIASGGLSHFVVDEALDQRVLGALRQGDGASLASIDPLHLQAGSSEIRNWIVVAEMARGLSLDWVEYIPAYRSPALTGTGLAFAAWQTVHHTGTAPAHG